MLLITFTDSSRPGHHLAHHLPRLDIRPRPPLAAVPRPIQPVSATRNNIESNIVAWGKDAGRHVTLRCFVDVESQALGPYCCG
jgi:hypothetical protein